MTMFVAPLTFLAAVGCVLGLVSLVHDLLFRDRARVNERIKQAFRDEMREHARQSPLFRDLKFLDARRAVSLDNIIHPIRTWIDQSGLSLTPWQLVCLSFILSSITVSIGFMLKLHPWLLGLLALSATPWPWIYVQMTRVNRRRKLCLQLPEAFEVMSRAIRVGQTIQAAFQTVANDFPPPISREFAHCYEQQHLGVPQETTLRDLARRTGVMELRIFVVAVIINSRTGGALSELLNKLAAMIRKRLTLQSRTRALTGEGRMQAWILAALPVVIFLFLAVWNPTYLKELTDRPQILAGCAVAQLIGALWIRRITNIDF
jgi:tight adherence protein B